MLQLDLLPRSLRVAKGASPFHLKGYRVRRGKEVLEIMFPETNSASPSPVKYSYILLMCGCFQAALV